MKEFLLFGLAPALAVTMVVLLIVNRQRRKIRRRWLSWSVAAASLLSGMVLLIVLIGVFLDQLNSGTWFCPICGALEERTTYAGWVVGTSTAEEDVRAMECAEQYGDWYRRVVQLEHEHGWIQVGCHSVGSAKVVCYRVYVSDSLFHASMPLVPDEELARGLVQRLAGATPAQRREMLRDFDEPEERGPFEPLVHGERPSREDFGVAYSVWLPAHPLWR